MWPIHYRNVCILRVCFLGKISSRYRTCTQLHLIAFDCMDTIAMRFLSIRYFFCTIVVVVVVFFSHLFDSVAVCAARTLCENNIPCEIIELFSVESIIVLGIYSVDFKWEIISRRMTQIVRFFICCHLWFFPFCVSILCMFCGNVFDFFQLFAMSWQA